VDPTRRPSDAARGPERETTCISLQQEWQSSADPVHQRQYNPTARRPLGKGHKGKGKGTNGA